MGRPLENDENYEILFETGYGDEYYELIIIVKDRNGRYYITAENGCYCCCDPDRLYEDIGYYDGPLT